MSSGTDFDVEHVEGVVGPEHLEGGYLHVVVFGPGHGEAVLIRTPDGRVGLIDGCGSRSEGKDRGSPIFELVKRLGVNRFLFACLTHPHHDHLLGFADLITEYPPEHLWWPGNQERALFDHYLRYIRKFRGDATEILATSKPLIRSLQPVVETIGRYADQPPEGLAPRPRVQALSDCKLILQHAMRDHVPLEIKSILPSSSGIRLAEQDSLNALNSKTFSAHRAVDPNRISAALVVSWGQTKVLLGGDAICWGSDLFQGWNGLQFPIGQVHLIKVPHHASEGAYAEALWDQMNPTLGIVTCVKQASDTQPPRPEMLETLIGRGTALALTSRPKWWSSAAHKLVAGPTEWSRSKSTRAKTVADKALGASAEVASGENKHENAVVVRLNEKGQILRVGLHGDARRLALRPV